MEIICAFTMSALLEVCIFLEYSKLLSTVYRIPIIYLIPDYVTLYMFVIMGYASFVRSSIHSSIHPSILLSVRRVSIRPSILFFRSFVRLFASSFVRPLIRPCVRPLIRPSVRSFSHKSIHSIEKYLKIVRNAVHKISVTKLPTTGSLISH